jgi:fibro-slime domain-containing protein
LYGLALGCSSTPRPGGDGSTVGGSSAGGTGATSGSSGGAPASNGGTGVLCLGDLCGAPPVERGTCGDGVLTDDEACDDGNTASLDGCSDNCLMAEVGYSCVTPGKACVPIAKCGDGVMAATEACDDGNTHASDGCSPRCTLEPGSQCAGTPSVCTPTTCGDGKKEGTESCDDGNTLPYDGCSAQCQTEPNCKGGACVSDCGDGLVIGEECDDGNSRSGDGCSDHCQVEPGFACGPGTAEVETLNVPIVYRDFRDHSDAVHGHPNFHWPGSANATLGIARVTLDADGKPEYLGTGNLHVDSQENFASWYRDTDYSIKVVDELPLTNVAGVFSYESEAFFPLDMLGWAADPTNPEATFLGSDGANHNFLFTSEVHYWFEYDAAKDATLSFRGDDDVWVFVAGKLVVDLGGVHSQVPGKVVLNAATTDTDQTLINLEQGKIYEIDVFQAERNPSGSNYKLSLSGFNGSPTVCTPVCGDGILTIGEQCDDGVNTGGYGKCGPGCLLTEYCGDGNVQGPEDCDDGNRVDDDACNNACRDLGVQ